MAAPVLAMATIDNLTMPNCLQVLRDRKCVFANCLVYFFILHLGVASAAGVSHGTYFAVYVDDSYIAVAIESRRTDLLLTGGTRVSDNQCKIVVLAPQAIFIATGIVRNSDPRSPLFDGYAIALSAYQRAKPLVSLRTAADYWATKMISPLTKLYPFYKTFFASRPDTEVTVGYFLGVEADGTLAGFQARIMRNQGSFLSSVRPLEKTYTMEGPLELVGEFLLGQSPRAKEVQAQIEREAAGKSPVERRVVELKHLVESVPVWAHDPGSGGDVAQIVIDAATKRWRWIYRPSFCAEN
jgi:hypothetical protein